VDADDNTAQTLLAEGVEHLGRLALQDQMRERLTAELDQPILQLPFVYGERFGVEELEVLTRVVEEVLG
jgi:hypothetical protein